MQDKEPFVWGISEKPNGQMNFKVSTSKPAENRDRFLKEKGLNSGNVVFADLIHEDNVGVVGERDKGRKIENTDSLVTNIPGVVLSITVADCLPVYFFDYKNMAIGLAHAGWRGVVKNIASKTIGKMGSEFATKPEELKVKIGPHIKKCHFEVRDDVLSQFQGYEQFVTKDNDKIKVDLPGIIIEQLKKEGVLFQNIEVSDDCTFCLDKKYFSFRRDKPEEVETMLSYLMIK